MFTKKRALLLTLLLPVLLFLSACGSLSEKPKTLLDSMEIPDDGIISASIFRELEEENGVITFHGESAGIYYEWTIFGSDIEECRDCNLAIQIEKEDNERILFRYLSDEMYGFSAVLSVYLNELWDAQSATVYQMKEGTEVAECSASITGKEKSILNFLVETPIGTYSVTPDVLNVEAEEDVIIVAGENGVVLQEDRKATQDEGQKKQEDSASMDLYLSRVEQQSGQVIAEEIVPGREQEVALENTSGDSTADRILSDGKAIEQDQYLTDPVPEGKPMPVEPENQQVNEKKSYTCTFSIECSTILNNLENLEPEKLDEVPGDGIILASQTVVFYEGESVYDVLQRVCKENGIQMEASWTPIYNSAYVEGIHNLYEFDCGSGSGWMYRVDGWYPNYGCSRYQLKSGEKVEWRYTCDLGKDVGGGYAIGE